jgi:hypothetical protein
MSDDPLIKVDMIFGTVKLVTDTKFLPDGTMLLGGHSERYDEFWRFVSRTETTWNLRMTME